MKILTPFLVVMAGAGAWSQPLTLREALATSLSRPSIQAARQAVVQARQEARAASAPPPLVLAAGASSPQDMGATDQDLSLSMGLDLFGRAAAQRRIGKGRVLLAEAEERRVRLAVQSEVLTRFFEAASAQRQSQASLAQLQAMEALHRAAVRRLEEGQIPEAQAIRASIELERARQASLNRKSQLSSALRRLAGALGSDEPPESVAEAELDKAGPDLESRPDLLALKAQILTSQEEGRAALLESRPEVELSAMRSAWGENPARQGLRLQATWRLFDHGRLRAERDAAQARAASLASSLADARRAALAEAAALDLDLDAAQSRLASADKMHRSALDLMEKYQKAYREGLGTLLEALEAAGTLREVEEEISEARLQRDLVLTARQAAAGVLMEEGR